MYLVRERNDAIRQVAIPNLHAICNFRRFRSMDNLVLSNILYRKTRTLTTMAGVALGVVLVVLTVGIAHGFLHDQGRRNAAVTAEIVVGPAGTTFGLSLNPTLSMPLTLADKIRSIDGVKDVVPVGQYLSGHVIDGIDYASFTR